MTPITVSVTSLVALFCECIFFAIPTCKDILGLLEGFQVTLHSSAFGKAVLYLKENEVSRHCNYNNSKHIISLVEKAHAQSLNETYSVYHINI